MNSRQIESWALRVIDCVRSGQPNEDFLIELKRDWIPEYKAARRIAGHANAARGENILWLIGIDEKQSIVTGASFADLASWYPAVESYFNELAPRMTPLNIPVDGVTVVALLFETDRAPFLVKNLAYGTQGGGSVELEVPWRENTSVRSARRSEIIRLLTPFEVLPEIEILDISLSAVVSGEDSVGNYHTDRLILHAELYIVPKGKKRVVIPFHRCRVEFEIPGVPTLESSWVQLHPSASKGSGLVSTSSSLTIQSTAYEIIVDDPGRISLKAATARPFLPNTIKDFHARVLIYLLPADADRPVVLVKNLPYQKEELPP